MMASTLMVPVWLFDGGTAVMGASEGSELGLGVAVGVWVCAVRVDVIALDSVKPTAMPPTPAMIAHVMTTASTQRQG